jgi:anti-anti-sigma regulatory factor
MLRIMITNGPAEQRWILQGRLVMPWVAELEKSWSESRSRDDARRCVVDLSDVTLIDAHGEKLLTDLRRAGAELIACGVYVKHLVEVINSQCEPR